MSCEQLCSVWLDSVLAGEKIRTKNVYTIIIMHRVCEIESICN